MASSKEMQPLSVPFMPNIFFKNQFCTKPAWPPRDTDLTGRVAIVTGANQGLGLECSDQLLSFGLSRLIIAVRSVAKGKVAAETLQAKYPKAAIDVFQLDMSSYDAITAFIARVKSLQRVDIVILNAGMNNTKFKLVHDTGHEETIQVNYLSTALLCIQLLPILKHKSVGGPGRISIVSSGLALMAKLRTTAEPILHSLDNAKTFDGRNQYNVSKLLGMMLLYRLTDYVSQDDVVVNVVDPGYVHSTSLQREQSSVASFLSGTMERRVGRSPKVGASTFIDAAVVKGKESHGCYLMSWEISPFASFLYTLEGKQAIERLWQETIMELNFADVQSTLELMKKI